MAQRKILVFSAHAADFCSRSGGTIALSTDQQDKVHIVDLTFGERGESEDYWKEQGSKSIEEAKNIRGVEAEEAAAVIGASIEFMDYGDYPLFINREQLDTLARLIRKQRPSIILTHWKSDPLNVDHEATTSAVIRASSIAATPGFDHDSCEPLPFPHIFFYEPTITRNDITGFNPDTYVDISAVFEKKITALKALRSQAKLPTWYTQWAEYRGAQATQWKGQPIKYTEAFKRYTATVSTQLPVFD